MIFVKILKNTIQIKNVKYFFNDLIFNVFNDMTPDMLSSKILNPIVTELFIRGRKLNISFVFIT